MFVKITEAFVPLAPLSQQEDRGPGRFLFPDKNGWCVSSVLLSVIPAVFGRGICHVGRIIGQINGGYLCKFC